VGSKFFPSFILKEDTLKDADGNQLLSEFGSNPVFADIDGDGDYDFFSGNSIGTLNFFENIGSAENFNFKFITQKWQDILIISGGLAPLQNPENEERHGASSIEFADVDNDSDPDLIWGDFFSRSLYYIENQGTASEPDMKVIHEFYPDNSDSLLTSGFNMPRLIDIDDDGDLDLFVSVLYDPTVLQSLIFYRNEGNAFNPNFRKVTDHFLKTLDTGIQSIPYLVDIDNDDDLDLFIGSAKNPNGSIFYFENTGSKSNPDFILRDSTFARITGELSLSPAFGDLNGDGKTDLIVGNFNGTISYYLNTGTSTQPQFSFQDILKDAAGNFIDVGLYARPLLFDVDGDNDPDLISGKFNGRFSFYRNIGNAIDFSFEEDTSYFSTIDVGDNSAPFLIDYDSDGDVDLFSGSRTGRIFYFKNDGNNSSPVWKLDPQNFIDINFGGDTSPFFADIDDDSDYDLFIGNLKGGLYFFRNQTITSISEKENAQPDNFDLQIYPNPFNAETNLYLKIPSAGNYTIIIYNILGEKITQLFSGFLSAGIKNLNWKADSDLPSGLYFISVIKEDHSITKKIFYLK